MSTIIIASLEAREGRTATAAGLGALLARDGRSARLLRIRAGEGADAPAEDDATTLGGVPGCSSPPGAVSEQEAQAQARDADVVVVEAPPGVPADLAAKLDAKVVVVSSQSTDLRLGDLASAGQALGEAFVGVVVTRQTERGIEGVRAGLRERGVACMAIVPEDRLLAGPSPSEIAEALHASRLAESGDEEEAVEFVMLGPVSADPGQPYFLQHRTKAVVNRFDKMDLHLAALATEPECLILTGGQMPSPYLLDRVSSGYPEVSVLLSPETTVRTVELIDELYGGTRFGGRRKLERAIQLYGRHVDLASLTSVLV